MDSMSISTRNEFTTLPKNLVRPKSESPDHDAYRESIVEVIGELFQELNNGVLPLPEEENVDSNSNDSSYTMRVSTSLPKANIAGKCSNLGLTSGFFKEAGEKTPHVAVNPFEILVEEKTELYSYGPPEIIVLYSPQLAGPSIFNFSGLSGWTIPSSSSNSSSLWILDSGATHHVCYSQASFEPFVPIFNSSVSLPNGHTVPVHGTGSVRLCDDLTLQNVLFVPQFHCNLLSISALTQQHPYVVSFYSDHYVIEDPTQGRKIGMGRQAGNLYILDLSNMFFVSRNNVSLTQSEPPSNACYEH
ncbi:hypothetical protein AAG906_026514 [Vitis piasezkii]